MKHFFTLLLTFLLTVSTFAQVGINNENPDASAALDITSTSLGFLPPRMTAVQRDAIPGPALGLMVFCTNCASGDGELQVNYVSGWKNIVGGETKDPPAPVIGIYRDGGIVFYIANEPTDLDGDGDLDTGLVAAFSDVATAVEWGCNDTDLLNVPNVPNNTGNPAGSGAEIGDGFNNTNNILLDCSTAPAALAARSYGPDWFLPSLNELNQMYDNKTTLEAVPGFTAFSNFYWSSTEYDNGNAWEQVFFNGNQGYEVKDFASNVRAVRAF